MRKVAVFDLDNTLIDSRESPIKRPHTFKENIIEVMEAKTYYVYIRPMVRTVLQLCRDTPDMSVVLFSAGAREYIYTVLEHVLMPHVGPDFYFDAICTQMDLDENGAKRMDWMEEKFHADRVLLVDDSQFQCMSAMVDGAYIFEIPPFVAELPGSEKDSELLTVLRHPFFY